MEWVATIVRRSNETECSNDKRMKETDEKKDERMEWKATIIREFKEQ